MSNIINYNFTETNSKKNVKKEGTCEIVKFKKKNIKMINNLKREVSFEEKVSNICSNAIATMIMSLEEDNIDVDSYSETYKITRDLYNILEPYVIKILSEEN